MELITKFIVWSNNHVLWQDIKNFNFKQMFSAPPLSPLLHYTWTKPPRVQPAQPWKAMFS